MQKAPVGRSMPAAPHPHAFTCSHSQPSQNFLLIGSEVYGVFEALSRERLRDRHPEDWPILAAALALGCPIWTEDTDFFGCGVATWELEPRRNIPQRMTQVLKTGRAFK